MYINDTSIKKVKCPVCPLTDECVKEICSIYTKGCYSAIKIISFVNKMDVTRDYHTKWSNSERERQISHITDIWNLKYDINKLISKQKQTHRYREQNCGCQREGWGGEGQIRSLGLADSN